VLDKQSDSREALLRALEERCAPSVLGLARPGGTEGRGWCLHDLGLRPLHLRGDGRSRARGRGHRRPGRAGKAKGLLNRLSSHATGRRSGDQFCVYVCDRFIVPRLSVERQGEVADGRLSLDTLTRPVLRERYEFRFVTTPDGGEALALEREVQRGALSVGSPSSTRCRVERCTKLTAPSRQVLLP